MSGNKSVQKTAKPQNNPNGISLHRTEATFFEGPIPPPDILERYEAICPGATERILSMAESQHNHRLEIEKQAVACNVRSSDHGRACGLLIGLFAIGCGTFLGVKGQQIAAAFIGGGGITGLVSVFIYGARSNRKEREAKARQMDS